jgi:hypothetical protein
MKITIKGARTQDEGRRAFNAAWHLGANAALAFQADPQGQRERNAH